MTRNRVILLPSVKMTTCSSWSTLRCKRRTLWHHAARNRLVAGVATACLGQDKQALKEMGIPVKKIKKNAAWTCRVAVLVEGNEHAQALNTLLPGWDVLDAVPRLEPEDEPEEDGTPVASGRVVTWMHALRQDLEVDYLIRATGWRGRLGLRGEESWLAQPKRRVVIVDFDDAWDLQASMDTEARVREYLEQGLELIWKDNNQPLTP